MAFCGHLCHIHGNQPWFLPFLKDFLFPSFLLPFYYYDSVLLLPPSSFPFLPLREQQPPYLLSLQGPSEREEGREEVLLLGAPSHTASHCHLHSSPLQAPALRRGGRKGGEKSAHLVLLLSLVHPWHQGQQHRQVLRARLTSPTPSVAAVSCGPYGSFTGREPSFYHLISSEMRYRIKLWSHAQGCG